MSLIKTIRHNVAGCHFTETNAGELFQNVETLDEVLTFVTPPDDAEVIKYVVGYGLGMMKYLLPGNLEMLGQRVALADMYLSCTTCLLKT